MPFRLMCVTMCLSVFSTNLVSSMCAPFYPKSASHHGKWGGGAVVSAAGYQS